MTQTRREFLKTLAWGAGGIAAGGSILPSCNNETGEERAARAEREWRAQEPVYESYVGPHQALEPMQKAQKEPMRELTEEEKEDPASKDKTYTEFVDGNGNVMNLNALTNMMKGRISTVSFMFATCPSVCPRTAQALAEVSKKNPDALHVVISVAPENDYYGYKDGPTLPQRIEQIANKDQNKNERKLLNASAGGNVLVLYPIDRSKDTPEQLANKKLEGEDLREHLKNGDGWTLQDKLKLVTNGKSPEGHSGAIALYEPSGQFHGIYADDKLEQLLHKLMPNVSSGGKGKRI